MSARWLVGVYLDGRCHDADVGEDPREEDLSHAARSQLRLEVRRRERAKGPLIDDNLAGQRAQRRHQLVAKVNLTVVLHAARAGAATALRERRRARLWSREEVETDGRAVALRARVGDGEACTAGGGEEFLHVRDGLAEDRMAALVIVLPEAARAVQKVGLHIDQDERRVGATHAKAPPDATRALHVHVTIAPALS